MKLKLKVKKSKNTGTIRHYAAHIVGKLAYLAAKPLGRGSSLPGKLALKINPAMLSEFQFHGKIIAVTGSNGKTTTSRMVAHILREKGYRIAHNEEGSNLTNGIATALLKNANIRGVVNADFVVLEVDERYASTVFQSLVPDVLLVTNLFRDQSTRNGNTDVVFRCLETAIKPTTKLILNANDPISARLAPKNLRSYYSLLRTKASTEACEQVTNDAKICPQCFGALHYQYYHYNQIGSYSCDHCGYHTPQADYEAESFNLDQGMVQINQESLKIEFVGIHHIMNLTGAIAASCQVSGMSVPEAVEKAGSFHVCEDRYREFSMGDRKVVMLLSKNQNPVSYDQSISYILRQAGEKTVLTYVNNINHTKFCDTTWLYDIGFERFKGQVDNVVCTGQRAYDVAVRLSQIPQKGFGVDICLSLKKIKSSLGKTPGTIYIMTELYDAKRIEEALIHDVA